MSKKISHRPPGPPDHAASTQAEARAAAQKKGHKKVAPTASGASAFASIGSSVKAFVKDTEDTAHRLAKSARVFGQTIRTELRKPEGNWVQALEQGLSDAAVAMIPRPDFMELADEAEDHLESLRSTAATHPKLTPLVEMAEAQYEGILGAGLTTAIWDYQHDPDVAVQSQAQHYAMDFADSLYRHRPDENNLDNLLLAYKSVGRDIAKIRQTVQRSNGIIDGTRTPIEGPGPVTGFPTVFSTQKAIEYPLANSWEELATSFTVSAVSSARISNTYFEPLLTETEDRIVGVVDGAHKGSPPFTHHAALGYLHKRIGNTDKALQFLRQAREIFRGVKGNPNVQELADEITVLTDLADLHPNDDATAKALLGEAGGLIDWLGETEPDVAVMHRLENMNAMLPIQQREYAHTLTAGDGTDPLAIVRYHRAIDDDYQTLINTAMQSKVKTPQLRSIVHARILEFAASQFEARLDAAMAQRLSGDKEDAEATHLNAVHKFTALRHKFEETSEPYFLKKALSHIHWANATYTFKTGDVEQSLSDLRTLTADYADTESGQILKYAPESMWVRQYGLVDDQGQLSPDIGKPSQVAKWKKIADKLLDDKASAVKAMMAGAGVAVVGAAAADTVFGTHIIGAETLGGLTLGKIGLIGAGAGLATERGYQVLAAQREISAAYTTGIANVTAEELKGRGKALATEVGICFLAGGAARYVRMGVMALGGEVEFPVLRGLLSEAGYVTEGAAFHEFSGALHGHTERTPLAYFKSFMMLRTLGAVNESNVASLLFPGEAWAEGVMRHGVHSALANIPLQALETSITGRLSEYGQGYFDSLFDLYAISVGSTVPGAVMHAPAILVRAKATHQLRSAQNLLTRMEQLKKTETHLQSDLEYAEPPKKRVSLTQKLVETMQARAAILEQLTALGLVDAELAQDYRAGVDRFTQRTEVVRGKAPKPSLMRYARIAALGPAIMLTGAVGPVGGGRKKSPTRISPPLQYYKPEATGGPDIETAPIQFKGQDLDGFPVEVSSFRDNAHSLSGFGFGIFKNAKGTISGGGLVYCSRVFMLDRKSGIAVDSHLPMETSELPEFVEQFDDLLAHLSDIGMDLRNTEVQVFYGATTPPLGEDLQAEGLAIADAIRSRGLKVTTIASALDNAEMSVSLEDGSFVAATDGNPTTIQDVSKKLSAFLDHLKKPGIMEKDALKILDTINSQLPQRFRLNMNRDPSDIIAQLKKIDSLAYFIPDWQIEDFAKSLEPAPSAHIKKVSAPTPTAPKIDLPDLPPPLAPAGATLWVESVIQQMASSLRLFLTPRRISIDDVEDRITSSIIAHNRSPIPEVQSLLSTGEIPSGEPGISAQHYFTSTHDAMARLHAVFHTTAAIDVETAFNQVVDGLQLSRHDETAILKTIMHLVRGRLRTATYMNKVDETIREKLAERLGTQGHYTDLDIEVARRDILVDILAKAYGAPVPKLTGHLSISAQGGMLVLRPDSLEDFKALNQTAQDESDAVETLPGGFFSVPKSIDIPISVISPGETSMLEVYRHELQHQLKHASNDLEPGELTWPHILVALEDKSVNLVGSGGKPDAAMVDRFLNFQRNRLWIMAKDEVLAYLIDGTSPNNLIDHLTEDDGFYDFVKFDEQKTTTALANHFGVDGVRKAFKTPERFNSWVGKLHERMRRVHNTGISERVHLLYDVLEHLIDHGYPPDAARHTLVLALSLVPFELWTGYLPKLQERLLQKSAPQEAPPAEPALARYFDLRQVWGSTAPKSYETIDVRLKSYISEHRDRITRALHELESPITLQRIQSLRQEFRTQPSRLQDLVDVLQSQKNDTETRLQVLKRRLKTHNTPELRKKIKLLEHLIAVQNTTLYRAKKSIALSGLTDLQHTLDNRLSAAPPSSAIDIDGMVTHYSGAPWMGIDFLLSHVRDLAFIVASYGVGMLLGKVSSAKPKLPTPLTPPDDIPIRQDIEHMQQVYHYTPQQAVERLLELNASLKPYDASIATYQNGFPLRPQDVEALSSPQYHNAELLRLALAHAYPAVVRGDPSKLIENYRDAQKAMTHERRMGDAENRMKVTQELLLGAIDARHAQNALVHQQHIEASILGRSYHEFFITDHYKLILRTGYGNENGCGFEFELDGIGKVGFQETDDALEIVRLQGSHHLSQAATAQFREFSGGVDPLPWLATVAGRILAQRARASGKELRWIDGERIAAGYPHYRQGKFYVRTLDDARAFWNTPHPDLEQLGKDYDAALARGESKASLNEKYMPAIMYRQGPRIQNAYNDTANVLGFSHTPGDIWHRYSGDPDHFGSSLRNRDGVIGWKFANSLKAADAALAPIANFTHGRTEISKSTLHSPERAELTTRAEAAYALERKFIEATRGQAPKPDDTLVGVERLVKTSNDITTLFKLEATGADVWDATHTIARQKPQLFMADHVQRLKSKGTAADATLTALVHNRPDLFNVITAAEAAPLTSEVRAQRLAAARQGFAEKNTWERQVALENYLVLIQNGRLTRDMLRAEAKALAVGPAHQAAFSVIVQKLKPNHTLLNELVGHKPLPPQSASGVVLLNVGENPEFYCNLFLGHSSVQSLHFEAVAIQSHGVQLQKQLNTHHLRDGKGSVALEIFATPEQLATTPLSALPVRLLVPAGIDDVRLAQLAQKPNVHVQYLSRRNTKITPKAQAKLWAEEGGIPRHALPLDPVAPDGKVTTHSGGALWIDKVFQVLWDKARLFLQEQVSGKSGAMLPSFLDVPAGAPSPREGNDARMAAKRIQITALDAWDVIQQASAQGITIPPEEALALQRFWGKRAIEEVKLWTLGAVNTKGAIEAVRNRHRLLTHTLGIEDLPSTITLSTARITSRYTLKMELGREESSAGIQLELYDGEKRLASLGFQETDHSIDIVNYQGGYADATTARLFHQFSGEVSPIKWLAVLGGHLLLNRAQQSGKQLRWLAGDWLLNAYPHTPGDPPVGVHTVDDARRYWGQVSGENVPPHTATRYDTAAQSLGFERADRNSPFHVFTKGAVQFGADVRKGSKDHGKIFDRSLEAATEAMRADAVFEKWIDMSEALNIEELQAVSGVDKLHITRAITAATSFFKESGMVGKALQTFLKTVATRRKAQFYSIIATLPQAKAALITLGQSETAAQATVIKIAAQAEEGAIVLSVLAQLQPTLSALEVTGPAALRIVQSLANYGGKRVSQLPLRATGIIKTRLLAASLRGQAAADLLCDLIRDAKNNTLHALTHLTVVPTTVRPHFQRIMQRINTYNGAGVFKEWEGFATTALEKQMPPEVMRDYTQFIADQFSREPRLGRLTLAGLHRGIQDGTLSTSSTPDFKSIATFIDRMDTFIPGLYVRYQKEGDAFLSNFASQRRKILDDTLSPDEMRAMDPSLEYALAATLSVSPVSIASHVTTDKIPALFEAAMRSGDLRHHIPPEWRGRTETLHVVQGAWRLANGKTLDPNHHIQRQLDLLLSEPHNPGSDRVARLQTELVAALQEYLSENVLQRENQLSRVQEALYRLASTDEGCRDQLGMAEDLNHTILIALDQIVSNKYYIPAILKAAFDVVQRQSSATIDSPKLAKYILKRLRAEIQVEKDKYQHQTTGTAHLSLRAVKGAAYGLYGLTSGVCTADDISIWQNPNYRLLAMVNEDTQKVVGYVETLEVVVGGKKYLTLPGINPSIEFMETVKAGELYPKLMEKVAAFAEAGNYDAVLIPKDIAVLSNRPGIVSEISRAAYKLFTLPEVVRWNAEGKYGFINTYVAWEQPHGAKP